MDAAAWLLVTACIVARQLLVSRSTLMAWDWYALFLFYITLSYVFPALALLGGVEFPVGSYALQFPGAATDAAGAMLLLLFCVTSWIGYSLSSVAAPELPPPVRFDRRLLFGLTAILGASTLAWIVAFGGLVEALTNVMMIRFGRVTADTAVPWFIGLTKAGWFCAVIALDAIIRRRREGARGEPLAWTLLAVSALALILRGSRGAIGNVILAVALYLFATRRGARRAVLSPAALRRRQLVVTGLVGFALAVVVLFKPTMTLIRVAATDYTFAEAVENFRTDVETGTSSRTGKLAVVGKVASEFSHFPIMTTLALRDDALHPGERDFGRDLFMGVAKLLPASIYEPGGVPLSFRSTLLILGRWESQVPPGILGWLIFTGGWLLVLPGGLLCGLLLALAERVTVHVLRRKWWNQAGYICFGVIVASGFIGGAPGDALREVVTMVVVIVAAAGVGSLAALVPARPRRSAEPRAGTPREAGA